MRSPRMSTQGRLLRNISAQLVSQVAVKILNIAVSLVLVRWFGPRELGHYAYISAYCYPFGAVADLGLGSLAIREISREPAREGEIFAALSRLYLLLTLGSSGLMLGLAAVTHHEPRILLGIALVGGTSLVIALTAPYLVAMNGREDLHRLSLYQTSGAALSGLATLATLLAGGGVIALLTTGLGTTFGLFFVARRLAGPPRHPRPATRQACLRLLRQAVPFGLVLVGFTVYYRLDMVLLRWFYPPEEVGRYAAAYRFLDAMLVLGAAVGAPFYPRLSSLLAKEADGAKALLEAAWRLMASLGLPLVVGASLVAHPLTLALFGEKFHDADGLVQLLVWAGLPVLLIAVPGHALNAADRVWYMAGVYWASVLFNLLLNLICIPRWGAEGAAAATVASAWLVLALVLGGLGALQPRLLWPGLWRPLAATAGMAVLLWASREAGLAVQILLGVASYGGLLLLLGYLRSADGMAVRRLLAQ